jgi:hypothetical protein
MKLRNPLGSAGGTALNALRRGWAASGIATLCRPKRRRDKAPSALLLGSLDPYGGSARWRRCCKPITSPLRLAPPDIPDRSNRP